MLEGSADVSVARGYGQAGITGQQRIGLDSRNPQFHDLHKLDRSTRAARSRSIASTVTPSRLCHRNTGAPAIDMATGKATVPGGSANADVESAIGNGAVKEHVTMHDKVAICGGSYGGYAALTGLAFTSDVFACGVDIVGRSEFVPGLADAAPKS